MSKNDRYSNRQSRERKRDRYGSNNERRSRSRSRKRTHDIKLESKGNIKRKGVKFSDDTIKMEDKKINDKMSSNENNKQNFNSTGILKKDKKLLKNGVELKYFESKDSCKPMRKWRLYEFKDNKETNIYHLHRLTHFIIGRDIRVCDIIGKHPSISLQHCVIQYRKIKRTNEYNERKYYIIPYIMDLKSRHGTFLNGKRIESQRFYELLPKDILKFGLSTRIYVFLAADSNKIDVDDPNEIKLKKLNKMGTTHDGNKSNIDSNAFSGDWSDDD